MLKAFSGKELQSLKAALQLLRGRGITDVDRAIALIEADLHAASRIAKRLDIRHQTELRKQKRDILDDPNFAEKFASPPVVKPCSVVGCDGIMAYASNADGSIYTEGEDKFMVCRKCRYSEVV